MEIGNLEFAVSTQASADSSQPAEETMETDTDGTDPETQKKLEAVQKQVNTNLISSNTP